jgi:hypothetical protein
LAYEHREGSGSLFKNDKREKDSQPNARGDALVGGILYEIAAWTKTDKKTASLLRSKLRQRLNQTQWLILNRIFLSDYGY